VFVQKVLSMFMMRRCRVAGTGRHPGALFVSLDVPDGSEIVFVTVPRQLERSNLDGEPVAFSRDRQYLCD
jgi:hypothetical protein